MRIFNSTKKLEHLFNLLNDKKSFKFLIKQKKIFKSKIKTVCFCGLKYKLK